MEPAPQSQEKSVDLLSTSLEEELAGLRGRGLERRLRRIDGPEGTRVEVDGREALLFCSNDYLGLAAHPDVVAAARDAAATYGAGAGSSRLVAGHMTPHAELESRIARWKGVESALLLSTGYQANLSVLTSVVGKDDVVVSDTLNHASIIDGCRLSRARVAVYRHNDVDHLDETLSRHAGARRRLVVTESVFSMDGDIAPLADIAGTARRHGAWLMVDEAHGAGVFGPGGAGVAAALGLTDTIDIHMGTLGKALGSFGAYVAGPRVLIDLLVNRARPFIFTPAPPPAATAAAGAALDVIEREPERATGLIARAHGLGRALRAAGLDVPETGSQILPVIIGDPGRAVAIAEGLLARGIYVAAIRPPSVPEGTSRLRVSLMATHGEADIDELGRALIETCGGRA